MKALLIAVSTLIIGITTWLVIREINYDKWYNNKEYSIIIDTLNSNITNDTITLE